jgi:hypothetical protein
MPQAPAIVAVDGDEAGPDGSTALTIWAAEHDVAEGGEGQHPVGLEHRDHLAPVPPQCFGLRHDGAQVGPSLPGIGRMT